MRPIVKVEHLSKQYRLGSQDHAHQTLRDTLAEVIKSPLKRRRQNRSKNGTIWALQDASFEVLPGEVVGLIGRNGAGKSTLLKILSRITEPTAGRVELYGRIGSLLEVGTGFHPELTGRENVYLSGAILGMRKEETDRRFDEIVAFSEIERFLDTPVKRYSSGMYMRLAFSVAAHLEPEILLVDEVLAVGDAGFQQKCLARMQQLKRNGTTIILVSHSISVIQWACQRALYLDDGRIKADGTPSEVVPQYLEDLRRRQTKATPAKRDSRSQGSGVTITNCEVFGADGERRRDLRFGEEARISISVRAERRVELPVIAFAVKRADGVLVCNFNNWYDNFKIDYIEGDCTLEGWLPRLRLVPGYYEIQVLVFPSRRGANDAGDLTRLQPLAVASFGEFTVEGPPLTADDGVFQEPALKWVLTRGDAQIEHDEIGDDVVYEVYGDKKATTV